MRVLLLFLAAVAAQAQVTIEDYKCPAATPASGSTTILTCNEPHGFDNMYAQAVALFDNAVPEGQTVTIGDLTYTFRSTLDNSAARQILIGRSKE